MDIYTLIDNGIYDKFLEYNKICWKIKKYLDTQEKKAIYKDIGVIREDIEYLWEMKEKIYKEIEKEYKFMEKFRKSLSAKKSRLKKRILGILENADIKNKYFITINFTNEALALKQETRKTYIRRYLKENFVEYVANIDFGSNKEYIDRKGNKRKATKREHYHSVVGFNDNINFNNFTLGGIDFEKIRLNVASVGKLGTYINKITSHAYKRSTGFNGCIYSRKSKK